MHCMGRAQARKASVAPRVVTCALPYNPLHLPSSALTRISARPASSTALPRAVAPRLFSALRVKVCGLPYDRLESPFGTDRIFGLGELFMAQLVQTEQGWIIKIPDDMTKSLASQRDQRAFFIRARARLVLNFFRRLTMKSKPPFYKAVKKCALPSRR